MKRLLAFFILFLFLGITAAHAQTEAGLSLSSTPTDPAPLSTVRVTAESVLSDISQSNITWRYNGKIVDGGIGRTSIVITAPAAGTVGTITASVGGTLGNAATLVLRPASIDLLWEAADSYTPPFYKGKALPSTNSLIRVTGIPSSVAPKQGTYTWSRNNSIVGTSSGYGKSSMIFKNSELSPTEQIGVTVSSGAFTGTANQNITPGDPSVVVYQKNEGFIDYANGSSNEVSTGQNGLVLRFEPFFFSVPITLARDLAFAITQGDIDVTSDTTQNELYLSAPEDKGSSIFTVAINTVAYTLQQLTRNFTINFN